MTLVKKELHDFIGQSTVLLIEPVGIYRNSFKNFLSNLKLKHKIVGTVAEARREMLTVKVGLFICEWKLPEKNGLAFCRELRKEKAYQSTPFLLISSENLRKDIILASEGGVNAYLLKPFSYEVFCSQLQQLIQAARNPAPIIAMMERAETHLAANEGWVAEALLKEALSLKPSSARAMAGMGRVHMLSGDQVQAMECFKKAVEFNPEYVEGHKYILQIAEDQADKQAILDTAKVLHELSPENPRYPLQMARAYMELGQADQSEALFMICVKLSPTLADAYRGLGMVYMHKREYEKATRSLEKALDLEKGDIPTLNSLGLSYIKQGKFQDGIRRYKMALAIDSFDARVLFNLGLAYSEHGDIALAREALQRAIASDPHLEKAKRQLLKLTKNLPRDVADSEIAIMPTFKRPA